MSAIVSKSYGANPAKVIQYCTSVTVRLDPIQEELQKKTLADVPRGGMLGAPEILTFGQHFIKLIKGKRAIDVGTFTGASALAWALAMPDDGEVFTLDVDHTNYHTYGVPIISKCEKTFKKIHDVQAPALETLDKFIAEGQSGTFDFAFIDADKDNYVKYYERIVQLLKSGGVVFLDNTLWRGKVAEKEKFPEDTQCQNIDAVNQLIYNDPRTNSILLNLGDGCHIAIKV